MNEQAKSIIADITERRDELAELLAPKGCSTLASHNWIVVMPGDICLKVEFEAVEGTKKMRAVDTSFGRPESVNRFTREDAETLAANMTNGKGEKGQAVFWKDQCQRELDRLNDLIAKIEKIA